jgi:hypothetical protein
VKDEDDETISFKNRCAIKKAPLPQANNLHYCSIDLCGDLENTIEQAEHIANLIL